MFSAAGHLLSISVSRAKFGIKKDYLTVTNTGYFVFECIPTSFNSVDGRNRLMLADKESFVADIKKLSRLLIADAKSLKHSNVEMCYNNHPGKQLRLSYYSPTEFSIDIENTGSEPAKKFTTIISSSDLMLIQRLIEHAIPYIYGWHVLESNKIAEDDTLLDEAN